MQYSSGSFSGTQQVTELDIKAQADAKKAQELARFFKTGAGEYGVGDKFLGLVVPKSRKIANDNYKNMSLDAIVELLRSEWHEERQIALFMLVARFKEGDEGERCQIYKIYLTNLQYINNWDLVDCSAGYIVGWYAYDHREVIDILDDLASSPSLWSRRIAVIATMYFVIKGDMLVPMNMVDRLLEDDQDLIQKANGWVLREVGKHAGSDILIEYLKDNYSRMPRTTLRYAIEKFEPVTRKNYLNGIFD
jgi:3-methyladenine DNA glycosylase AlkD